MMRPTATFRADTRGFTGAEKALLITFGLAVVLLCGKLISGGSQRAAEDAQRVLITQSGTPGSLSATPAIEPVSAQATPAASPAAPTLSEPSLYGSGLTYSDQRQSGGQLYDQGTLYSGPPSPGDVRQGALGDCFYLSSLGAIANTRPDLLSQFASGPDKSGDYTFNFYQNGKLTPVTVDSKLPVSQSGELAYAQYGAATTLQNAAGQPVSAISMWVPLAEKAYAQLEGGYGDIAQGGWPSQALAALTGAVSQQVNPGTLSRAAGIALLQQAQQNNWPMVASTLQNSDPAATTRLNLVIGHAYAILGVKPDGSVMLRNPWGFKNPGTSNDSDPPTYISYDDFVRTFQDLAVSKVPAAPAVAAAP